MTGSPAWSRLGMRQETHFRSGGHCRNIPYDAIAACLDEEAEMGPRSQSRLEPFREVTVTGKAAKVDLAGPTIDADAAAAYYGGYYGHPGYYGYGYGLGYRGYYGYGYPRYGYYGHHYGKRSADAEPEAEAAYLSYYGGYPYAYGYPYGYRAYYAPAASSSFQHVSTGAATYGISQLHKRSADAEPEADADAAYYYGGYYGHPGYYGHGYGYGYGLGYGRYYGGYGYGRFGYYG